MEAPRSRYICGDICTHDSTIRTSFEESQVLIYAWPSRGGLIILNNADAVDSDFLGLNPLDPPSERLEDQKEEDAFCQRLLLLGAKWWDSKARYTIIVAIGEGAKHAGNGAFVIKEQPGVTMREKRFVKVAWPWTGGLWVAEFDTVFAGVDEENNILPEAPSRLLMARTMDERSQTLRDHFEATFYKSVDGYTGHAFLKSWEEKNTGEAGPLLQPNETVALWKKARMPRSRDSLLSISV